LEVQDGIDLSTIASIIDGAAGRGDVDEDF
jgi:hypothetical protein